MFLKVQSSSEFPVLIRQHGREVKRGEKALISHCATRESKQEGEEREHNPSRRVCLLPLHEIPQLGNDRLGRPYPKDKGVNE